MVENCCADDLQIGCMIYDRMNILDVYQKKLDNVSNGNKRSPIMSNAV